MIWGEGETDADNQRHWNAQTDRKKVWIDRISFRLRILSIHFKSNSRILGGAREDLKPEYWVGVFPCVFSINECLGSLSHAEQTVENWINCLNESWEKTLNPTRDHDLYYRFKTFGSRRRPNLRTNSKNSTKTEQPSFWNYSKSFRNSKVTALRENVNFEQICDLVAPELISSLIYFWWTEENTSVLHGCCL